MNTSHTFDEHRYTATDMPINKHKEQDHSKAAPRLLFTQRLSKFLMDHAESAKTGYAHIEPLDALAEQKTSDTPWQILFQAMNNAEPQYIGLDIKGLAMIGRADPDSGVRPDLDLTPYEAQTHGVSRRHAVMVPTDEGLCLIDLDSANGTWLGGKYLSPGQKYRLRSGDMIEFGSLKLIVRVLGASARGLSINSTGTVGRK